MNACRRPVAFAVFSLYMILLCGCGCAALLVLPEGTVTHAPGERRWVCMLNLLALLQPVAGAVKRHRGTTARLKAQILMKARAKKKALGAWVGDPAL